MDRESYLELESILRDIKAERAKPRHLPCEFFKYITDNFSPDLEVGRGGFGVVYKGVLKYGDIVVVKRLRAAPGTLDKQYENEANLLSLKHENIVRILGYCSETRQELIRYQGKYCPAYILERLICLEYMPNGSLDRYIKDELTGLEWNTRYQIIKGISDGLQYLHMKENIIHMYLKPNNILLDDTMVPKIADFGLSRLGDKTRTTSAEHLLSNGYCAPEYLLHGKMSAKSDIYSLGVIILDIVTGTSKEEPSINKVLEKWRQRWRKTAVHQPLWYKQVTTCLNLAQRCTLTDPRDRPNISDIIRELQKTNSMNDEASDVARAEFQDLGDMVGVDPLTMHLSVELNKQIPAPSQSLVHVEFRRLQPHILQRLNELCICQDSISREVDILECDEKAASDVSLKLLQLITNNFSGKLRIGYGGCGEVYMGILPRGPIAVKKFVNFHTIDDTMFNREVKSMLMVWHQNVVRLLGYCSYTEEKEFEKEGKIIMAEVRERLLCSEYISNGSLEDRITDELRGLEWNTRYQIIKGICDGLNHLHVEKHIIHMDLKPANILLDDNMVPKITDFGLSRLDDKTHTLSAQRLMSLGYCAPEYQHNGKMSAKSDIYSLGVIILQIITGSKVLPRIPKVLKKWRHRWSKTAVHNVLWYKQVNSCLELAQRCTLTDPRDRPKISNIIHELQETDSMDEEASSATDEFQELGDMLGVDPLTIKLSVELNKPKSCSIVLTNDSNDHFAFRITTDSVRPYDIRPSKDIVAPRSTCGVTITLPALEKAPHHSSRKDEFSLQSTKVDGSLTINDISQAGTFNEKAGKEVDDVNLIISLVVCDDI